VATAGRIFELAGGHAALDLVNTLDWRFREGEPEELLTSYDDLIAFVEQNGLLAARQARALRREGNGAGELALREARDLREALASVFYAQLDEGSPGPAQMRRLEGFMREARNRERLVWAGARAAWELASMETVPELPVWLLARSAAGLIASQDVGKLRACGDPQCRWLFLDTSKNHTRRWCDMKVCGNRMKARRFKAQHKG
jgi:predicted RNA-binding Zn ribbon-like protein